MTRIYFVKTRIKTDFWNWQRNCNNLKKTFYEVYNELGYGFLEKVYQNSLYLELKNKGYKVEAQKKILVYYKGIEVGE